jgi:hypothetical protein
MAGREEIALGFPNPEHEIPARADLAIQQMAKMGGSGAKLQGAHDGTFVAL